MKQWLGYMFFKDEKDFQENTFPHYKDTRRIGGGIIDPPANYPACFKYFGAFEPGFMGEWRPCEMEEAFFEWDAQLQEYAEFVKSCKDMVKGK